MTAVPPVLNATEAADAGAGAALDWFRAELNERLVVHWTGGAWRVPLATRHLAVTAADGSGLGRIVCAESADMHRAFTGLRPGAGLDADRLEAALAPFARLMTGVRALEGFAGDGWDIDAAARAMSVAADADGPVALLSAADRPVSELIGRLAALAGRGAVWKPAPGAAASAHLAMRALAPHLGAALALVQGDHATGAVLAQGARPVWLGRAAPPRDLGDQPRGQSPTPQAILGSIRPSASSSRRP